MSAFTGLTSTTTGNEACHAAQHSRVVENLLDVRVPSHQEIETKLLP